MLPISDEQKKMIHTLKSRLGLDEELYRETLFNSFNVDSSKKLSREQARRLIISLKESAVQAKVWKNNRSMNKYKYDNLGKRDGMATPRQLRMLESIWKDVSYQKTEQSRLEAFNQFLSNRFGVDDIKWVESNMVSKIVNTLKAMKAQQAQKESQCLQ